jgi:hypothetical protein
MSEDNGPWIVGHGFGPVAAAGERIPLMTRKAILGRAEDLMQASDPSAMSYDEIVQALTVAQYVGDLLVKELGDRGQLARDGDTYVIPSALPGDMFIENVLTEW